MEDYLIYDAEGPRLHISVEHLSPLSTWINTVQTEIDGELDYQVQEIVSQHIRFKIELTWSDVPPFTYIRKVLYEAELIPVIANSFLERDTMEESWNTRISKARQKGWQIYPIVLDNYVNKLMKYESQFNYLVSRNLLPAAKEHISKNGPVTDNIHILFAVAPNPIIDVSEKAIIRMIKHEQEREQELFQIIPTLN